MDPIFFHTFGAAPSPSLSKNSNAFEENSPSEITQILIEATRDLFRCQYDAVIAKCTLVLQTNSNENLVLQRRAEAYYYKKDYHNSLVDALSASSKNIYCRRTALKCYLKMENFIEAGELLPKRVDLQEDKLPIDDMICRCFMHADYTLATKNFSQITIGFLEEAKKKRRDDYRFDVQMGKIYENDDQTQMALAHFNEALRILASYGKADSPSPAMQKIKKKIWHLEQRVIFRHTRQYIV